MTGDLPPPAPSPPPPPAAHHPATTVIRRCCCSWTRCLLPPPPATTTCTCGSLPAALPAFVLGSRCCCGTVLLSLLHLPPPAFLYACHMLLFVAILGDGGLSLFLLPLCATVSWCDGIRCYTFVVTVDAIRWSMPFGIVRRWRYLMNLLFVVDGLHSLLYFVCCCSVLESLRVCCC